MREMVLATVCFYFSGSVANAVEQIDPNTLKIVYDAYLPWVMDLIQNIIPVMRKIICFF